MSYIISHVQVKWRANLRAIGFLEIEVDGKKKLVDIGEVLPNHQRVLYALGTLNFGDRQKITAITTLHKGNLLDFIRITDNKPPFISLLLFVADGSVSAPKPPKPSIHFNKSEAEKDLMEKFGIS